ncbi:MAG: hypothetical protein KatS3mg108_2150 [Isosphaeraceae bacterium]|nr:MAG: hypothetical protein KatS3mg108_2150 [Isosphaeraceae bacterium]
MANDRRATKVRRRYAPRIEALEALRLLDAAPGVAPLILAQEPLAAGASPSLVLEATARTPTDAEAWDAALAVADAAWSRADPDLGWTEAVASGLTQLDRYLGRTWVRAGLAPQQFDDCTQAVHATMLQHLGREGFDQMLAAIGRGGVPKVLNRDSALGPDFFRAVDMVKKRAQRQRYHLALDERPDLVAPLGDDGADLRGVLLEVIDRSLEPREAELIRETLKGYTPAEIADRWGLAPKTVSNQKSRALAKLRDALLNEAV